MLAIAQPFSVNVAPDIVHASNSTSQPLRLPSSSSSSSSSATSPSSSSSSSFRKPSSRPPIINTTSSSFAHPPLSSSSSSSSSSTSTVRPSTPQHSQQFNIHAYPAPDLLRLLASLLTQIAATNDSLSPLPSPTSPISQPHPFTHSDFWTSLTSASRTALTTPAATLTFHARNIPTISLEAYLLRILKYCPTTNEVFLSLLVYFDRMSKLSNDAVGKSFVIDSYNIHRLVIAGVTVASKFFSDVFYTNSRYAKVGGLPLTELNQLELQFLLLNDFRLVIPTTEMQRYAEQLVLFSNSHLNTAAVTTPIITTSPSPAEVTTLPNSTNVLPRRSSEPLIDTKEQQQKRSQLQPQAPQQQQEQQSHSHIHPLSNSHPHPASTSTSSASPQSTSVSVPIPIHAPAPTSSAAPARQLISGSDSGSFLSSSPHLHPPQQIPSASTSTPTAPFSTAPSSSSSSLSRSHATSSQHLPQYHNLNHSHTNNYHHHHRSHPSTSSISSASSYDTSSTGNEAETETETETEAETETTDDEPTIRPGFARGGSGGGDGVSESETASVVSGSEEWEEWDVGPDERGCEDMNASTPSEDGASGVGEVEAEAARTPAPLVPLRSRIASKNRHPHHNTLHNHNHNHHNHTHIRTRRRTSNASGVWDTGDEGGDEHEQGEEDENEDEYGDEVGFSASDDEEDDDGEEQGQNVEQGDCVHNRVHTNGITLTNGNEGAIILNPPVNGGSDRSGREIASAPTGSSASTGKVRRGSMGSTGSVKAARVRKRVRSVGVGVAGGGGTSARRDPQEGEDVIMKSP